MDIPVNLAAYPTLLERLKRVSYRRAFVSASTRNLIALQIRALRKSKFQSQAALGDAAGKPANVISRLENPNYGKVTIQTLIELANAFNVALVVRFTTFAELASRIEDTSDAALEVPSFEEELQAISTPQDEPNEALNAAYQQANSANGANLVAIQTRTIPEWKEPEADETPIHHQRTRTMDIPRRGSQPPWEDIRKERAA